MPETCTREEIRELDRRAIEEYGMPSVVLMENAGAGAAGVASRMLGDPCGMDVLVFCGKGNNGGDGFVVARHLHNKGACVTLVLGCRPEEIPSGGEAGVNLAIAGAMGLPLLVAEDEAGRREACGLAKRADLLVDALFGTGLSGDVRDPYLSLIRLINAADKPVLAVDIPSGLDANIGKVLRAAVRADRTATFVLPKRGFRLQEGPAHVGAVDVIDIGMPRELVETLGNGPPEGMMGAE
jgi:NAD(P)H-hydrate epimerase